MRKPESYLDSSVCRSRDREENTYGKDSYEDQAAASPEVLYKRVHTLQNMRTSAFSFKKVRNMQSLLP